MKILWIINTVLPEIAADNNMEIDNGGGWLSGILAGLKTYCKDLDITVAFPYRGEKLKGEVGDIKYLSFYEKNCEAKDNKTAIDIRGIIESVNPDVIHIFGTEYSHALFTVREAAELGKGKRVVINIQGLISECAKKYYAGLPFTAVHKFTLRDFLKRDNVAGQRRSFAKRGKSEIAALKQANRVIGRTEWDKDSVLKINDKLTYHKCNESLRREFYSGSWDYESCEKHSIFVGSCSYPLKGFHRVIGVMPELLKKYPDAKVYVTGESPFSQCGLKNLKHKTYYQVYLKKLILKYGLKDKIVFLGGLNAEKMKERMLKSNAFVLSSSIENSPNTLGEAMLLGVPSVASSVGGVTSFIRDGENGLLYPFDERQTLITSIDKIFSDCDFAKKISVNAQQDARGIFDGKKNAETLYGIYSEIVSAK